MSVESELTSEQWVRRLSLAMTAVATGSAELAIAEPGQPAWISLAWAAAWCLLAFACHIRPGPWKRSSWRGSAAVVVLVAVFLAPVALTLARWAVNQKMEAIEAPLISALRNLGLGLAVLAWKPGFAKQSVLVSLFLTLFASSVAEGPLPLALLGVYAALGGVWLARVYWDGLKLPAANRPQRFPFGLAAIALGGVGLTAVVAAVGPNRAAAVLAGFMPSSGGVDWDDPDARGGVNDGENETSGSEKPQSIGFADTDAYLDSDRPSLYDAFNDMYGEPAKPKQHDRMIALSNQNVQEQRERPAENLRAGRQFSAVRRKQNGANRRPGDLEAKALLYVHGQTPLHLGLAAYDCFDGRDWKEEPRKAMDCPLVMESESAPWFRIDLPFPSLFTGTVAHKIKVGTLDSSVLPLPPHVCRFRIGQVNRRDFFGWSHEGMLRMTERTVPSSTVIESESRVCDLHRVREVEFPPEPYAAERLLCFEEYHIQPEIQAIARAWAADRPRGWSQVEAILAKLRAHAVLDHDAAPPVDCEDVVGHFLLESRRGPDYLFASSAVVLLRALGYPARLVSGLYASPGRYDPRTRHTPVTKNDVHVWAEVRTPQGTWTTVEPTPGYEVMSPAPTWIESFLSVTAAAWRWSKSHPILILLAALTTAAVGWFRRELNDAAATLAWRARLSLNTSPRRRILLTVALIEKRSRWSGRPRPTGETLRRWYGPLAARTCEPGGGLRELLNLADWGLYAPAAGLTPSPLGALDPHAVCRQAVRDWPLSRFRSEIQQSH